MATQTFTRLIDDIDGGKAERTVAFSLDGKDYSIDLSRKNIAAMEKALRPFVEAAQPARRKNGQQTSRRKPSGSSDLGAVRAWARENGYEISDRGRVRSEIRSAYDASRN